MSKVLFGRVTSSYKDGLPSYAVRRATGLSKRQGSTFQSSSLQIAGGFGELSFVSAQSAGTMGSWKYRGPDRLK